MSKTCIKPQRATCACTIGGTQCCALVTAVQIEFDDAPQLANATWERRRDWWQHTKQLQHGSLVALWWDGDSNGSSGITDGNGPALPNIMFATICERDEKQLAAKGEPRRRPQLAIK